MLVLPGGPIAIAKLRDMTLATRLGFTRDRKPSPPPWASQLMPSTGLGLAADEAKRLLDAMPIAYAVTYMFGTVGSAIVIAVLGPALSRIDLPAACKDYEEKHGGGEKELGGAGSAWHDGNPVLSACSRREELLACGPLRPRRWSPTRVSLFSAFAVTESSGSKSGHHTGRRRCSGGCGRARSTGGRY